jgi:hypothetical protein
VLASILPGLREIRAPLAAGYLWLVIGWLLFHDRVETGSSASGAVDALTGFRDAIGLGGIAAAATFVAYVLGALWEPLAGRLAEAIWATYTSWRKKLEDRFFGGVDPEHISSSASADEWFAESAYRGLRSDVPPGWSRISPIAWSRLGTTGRRLAAEVDDRLAVRMGHLFDRTATEAMASHLEPILRPHAFRSPVEGSQEPDATAATLSSAHPARDSWWIDEAPEFKADLSDTDEAWYRLMNRPYFPIFAIKQETLSIPPVISLIGDAELTGGLFGELPLVARRLVGEEQEHFLEASRMKGEVEFRYALAIPLAIAVSVLLFGVGAPSLVWGLGSFVGILAGLALLADGWRRDEARNDYLVELLAIGRAKSPTFERLLERAEQAVGGNAPIDEVGVREAATDSRSPASAQSAEASLPDKTAGARAARSP